MKLVKDNIVYVELKDLSYLGSLPSIVLSELKINYKEENQLIKFESPESREFFNSKDEILNYSFVKKMDSNELDTIIQEKNHLLNTYAKEWLDSSIVRRNNLDKNIARNDIMRKVKYQRDSLIDYRDNKERYAEIFNQLGKVKVLEKKL